MRETNRFTAKSDPDKLHDRQELQGAGGAVRLVLIAELGGLHREGSICIGKEHSQETIQHRHRQGLESMRLLSHRNVAIKNYIGKYIRIKQFRK